MRADSGVRTSGTITGTEAIEQLLDAKIGLGNNRLMQDTMRSSRPSRDKAPWANANFARRRPRNGAWCDDHNEPIARSRGSAVAATDRISGAAVAAVPSPSWLRLRIGHISNPNSAHG